MSSPAFLGDLLVVDASRYLPGPLVSRLLADLGARVLKVEEPKLGDPARQVFPGGREGLAALLLAGHESIALDLKQEAGLRCLEELLISADVFVESFRPGTLERLGLSVAEIRRRYPRLILCSVTGWGVDGPHAHRPGHDLTYRAIAGSLAGGRDMPASQTADIVGAWSAVTSILAALYRRQRDGQGCWIDQALLDAAGHAAITAWAAEADGPKADAEPLLLTGAIPCYSLYPTRGGGRLALAALEPHFWQRFCVAIERPDLVSNQYDSSGSTHREVAKIAASRSREEWLELFADLDIPVDPVLTPTEALEHPQVRARELLRQGPDDLPRLGFPARFDGVRPRGGNPLPVLGEHTESLVEEFGLARDLSPRRRRARGIGRQRSFKRWAAGVAGKVLGRRKPD
ncbi:MAG: CaiB/BaiF CoA-transferase family protein [Acidobacteriota bacterium]